MDAVVDDRAQLKVALGRLENGSAFTCIKPHEALLCQPLDLLGNFPLADKFLSVSLLLCQCAPSSPVHGQPQLRQLLDIGLDSTVVLQRLASL